MGFPAFDATGFFRAFVEVSSIAWGVDHFPGFDAVSLFHTSSGGNVVIRVNPGLLFNKTASSPWDRLGRFHALPCLS